MNDEGPFGRQFHMNEIINRRCWPHRLAGPGRTHSRFKRFTFKLRRRSWLHRVSDDHDLVWYLPTYIPSFLSIYLFSVYLPTYLSFYVSTYIPFFLCIYLHTFLYIYLPFFLYIYLPTFLSMCLPTYAPYYRPTYLPTILPLKHLIFAKIIGSMGKFRQ